jgi:hypothetical protein
MSLSIKLNSYLAIILAIGLMLGEVIRSWGKIRNVFSILDDFIFGFVLIFGAILTLKKVKLGYPILIAGWASCFGMTYGSFFNKIINLKADFQSNINNDFLTFLVGLAFITSIIGLIWSISLYKK